MNERIFQCTTHLCKSHAPKCIPGNIATLTIAEKRCQNAIFPSLYLVSSLRLCCYIVWQIIYDFFVGRKISRRPRLFSVPFSSWGFLDEFVWTSTTSIGTDHQFREMMISEVNFMHYNYELAIEIKFSKRLWKAINFKLLLLLHRSFIFARNNNTFFEVLKVNFISGCLLWNC